MVGLVNHSLLRNGIQILEEYQQSVFFIYFFVDSQAVGSEIIDLELILCRNENDRKIIRTLRKIDTFVGRKKMYCLIDKIDNHQSQLSLGG